MEQRKTRKPSRQEAAGRILGSFTQDPRGEGGLSSVGHLMRLLGMGADVTQAAGGPQWLPEEYRNVGTRYLELDDDTKDTNPGDLKGYLAGLV